MHDNEAFPVRAPRLLQVRSSAADDDDNSLLTDAEGFLDVASETTPDGSQRSGQLLTPLAASAGGALVILGEPGAGKTTVFRSLVESLSELDEATYNSNPFVWVDGSDLVDASFDDLVTRPLNHIASPTEKAVLTLVLDQLDESPMLSRLATRLRMALRSVARDACRIFVGCRTADYPPKMHELLKDRFGSYVRGELVPLTRMQAEDLASSRGLNGPELINRAIAAGAGHFASNPLTLDLLVTVQEQEGGLEGTPADLFASGVRHLLEEPDPNRRQAAEAISSVGQRRAIAGRIAARLLLSGRRTIWLESGLLATAVDLVAGSLDGGTELTSGGQFEVRPVTVTATLRTALFNHRGPRRLAFRHSSLAAYLAASYLQQHKIPVVQLQSLFLVAGDEDTATIPVALRETAAWLVTLDPSHSEWLAAADPVSLAGHSTIVDSDATRALLASVLLSRAAEVELNGSARLASRWQLRHPGLAAQLAQALEIGQGDPADWTTHARVRLATRLAASARLSELVDPLIRLSEDNNWNAHVRALAVRAAFVSDPGVAAPRLLSVLARLSNERYAEEQDPDDELRAELLDALYPDYMASHDVVKYLTPRRRTNLVGGYWMLLRTFPDRVPRTDLPQVLSWARRAVSERRRTPNTQSEETAGTRPELAVDAEDTPIGQLDGGLFEALIDHTLALEDRGYLPFVADLLWARLTAGQRVTFPRALDMVDPLGVEPESTKSLRRSLAHALLELASKSDNERRDIWPIFHSWDAQFYLPRPYGGSGDEPEGLRPAGRTTLLDSGDFGWAIERMQAATAADDGNMAEMWGQVIDLLFDPSNEANVEEAYKLQDTAAWARVRWRFEAWNLDDEHVKIIREHSAARADRMKWDRAEDFERDLLALLSTCKSERIEEFWRLAWNLQINPLTGRGNAIFESDDLMSFPAVPLLQPNAAAEMISLAERYVLAEADHRDTWLGTATWDKRAWAGYLALALLLRNNRLKGLPPTVWKNWCGAVLWFHAASINSGDSDSKKKLLDYSRRHASSELIDAINSYVRGALGRAEHIFELRLLTVEGSEDLQDALLALTREIEEALRALSAPSEVRAEAEEETATKEPPDSVWLPRAKQVEGRESTAAIALSGWAELLEILLGAGHESTVDYAAQIIISTASSKSEILRGLAVRAANLLLAKDPKLYWPAVFEQSVKLPQFGKEWTAACATGLTSGPVTRSLDEQQLAALYRNLEALYPQVQDSRPDGFHFMGPDEQARDWRDYVLRALTESESVEAVAELRKLTEEYPAHLNIAASLVISRTRLQASLWLPIGPDRIALLLADGTRRLVRDPRELALLTLAVLSEIEQDLPGHCELLWDRLRAKKKRGEPTDQMSAADSWLPKPEAALCAYLSHELKLRLGGRAVVVNREVLVRPSDPYGAGDRTDITMDAIAVRDGMLNVEIEHARQITMVIEVKGPWNRKVLTAQDEQLAAQYLPETGSTVGIYVVGWYPLHLWTSTADYRRALAAAHTEEDLRSRLESQAGQIASGGSVRVFPFVMRVPRPAPHN